MFPMRKTILPCCGGNGLLPLQKRTGFVWRQTQKTVMQPGRSVAKAVTRLLDRIPFQIGSGEKVACQELPNVPTTMGSRPTIA
jgi:hypothetical protein